MLFLAISFKFFNSSNKVQSSIPFELKGGEVLMICRVAESRVLRDRAHLAK